MEANSPNPMDDMYHLDMAQRRAIRPAFAFPLEHMLLPAYVFVALKLEIDQSPAKASLQLPRAGLKGHVGQANFGEEVVRILCVL